MRFVVLEEKIIVDKRSFCPKCRGKMEEGYLLGAWSWMSNSNQSNTRQAKKIFGFACKKCSFVEFYLKK